MMDEEQLNTLLQIVSDALSPECYIADMVINDGNLSDDNINFALSYLRDHQLEFLRDHPDATLERIMLVKLFLMWLRGVSETVRDAFMEEYHS